MLRRGFAPATLVIAVAVATWLLSGVAAHEIVLFLGYEIGFVGLPGATLLWALRGRRPGYLEAVALGWPLGHVVEILAFSATASTGSRGLYVLFPFVVVVPSAILILRRRQQSRPDPGHEAMSGGMVWTAAAALALGLTYLAIAFLPHVPLPSANASVAYNADVPYFIGLVAEAKNHWPATSPGLSGMPLHYEWFVFFHMAAVSQVTHLEIATVALRLDIVPSIIVIGHQLLLAGRSLAGAAWTGVVAIAVVFLLGPLDLTTDAGGSSPFFDLFSTHLWASWTLPFGLMFFLALLYLVAERLRAASWRGGDDLRSWGLIALLMVGSSGAKATILPVLLTGAGLYALLTYWTRRTVAPAALITLALGATIFVATFFIVYGGGVPGTGIQPLASLDRTVPVIAVNGIALPTIVRALALAAAYPLALAGMLLPLTGGLYLLRARPPRATSVCALCVCMLGAGLLIANSVHQVGYSELYFQDTGYVAGCILAAAGLRWAWVDVGGELPISRRAAILSFVGWIALLLVIIALTSRGLSHRDALIARYGFLSVGCVAFVAAWRLVPAMRNRARYGTVMLGLIPLLAASALASPVELAPTVQRMLTGAPITVHQADPQTVRGLTPGLLTALQWLRSNSAVDAVLAVNNHWADPGESDGRYYYYSAFSERRVFIEAYDPVRYGITTGILTQAGVDFVERQRWNDAVFDHADVGALRILTERYSVRYLFIDRIHHDPGPAVLHLGKVVFTNHDATIIAVG